MIENLSIWDKGATIHPQNFVWKEQIFNNSLTSNEYFWIFWIYDSHGIKMDDFTVTRGCPSRNKDNPFSFGMYQAWRTTLICMDMEVCSEIYKHKRKAKQIINSNNFKIIYLDCFKYHCPRPSPPMEFYSSWPFHTIQFDYRCTN